MEVLRTVVVAVLVVGTWGQEETGMDQGTGKHWVTQEHTGDPQAYPKAYLERIFQMYLPEQEANLTRRFFAASPPTSAGKGPTYILQAKNRSRLAVKSATAFASLGGLQVDFYNPADDSLDPFSSLHTKEAALVGRSVGVSRAAMWLNIRQVFSLPSRMGTTDQVGTFLYRKLGRLGLGLLLQTFQYSTGPLVMETGVNLVSVLPGLDWASPQDRVMVLGASWHLGSPASGDLGSGLASLLEVARVLMKQADYKPRYSVIFVAFDKEREERMGSRAFVAEYLIPQVIRRYNCSVQGFLNLETIFSYSGQPNSQTLPPIFEPDNREVVQRFQRGGGRGNFVSLVTRGLPEELALVERLTKHLTKEGVKVKHFSFPSLALQPDQIPYLERYSDIWNSSSGRFWFGPDATSLPAVTVSDLGRWRQQSTTCTTATCSTQQIQRVFMLRTQFLAATTRALVNTVREATTLTLKDPVTDSARLYSLLATFLASLTGWQARIEDKVTQLQHLYRESGHVTGPHTRTNSSYYVLGKQSIGIPVLKHIISQYYEASNYSYGHENSPMVIKIVT